MGMGIDNGLRKSKRKGSLFSQEWHRNKLLFLKVPLLILPSLFCVVIFVGPSLSAQATYLSKEVKFRFKKPLS